MSYNITFTLRDYKAKTPQAIRANFRANGLPFKINTHKKAEPQNWSKAKQIVLSSVTNASETNKYLKQFSTDLEAVISDFEFKKIRLNQNTIQEAIDKIYKRDKQHTGATGVVDFISFIDFYISLKKPESKGYRRLLDCLRNTIVVAFNCGTKKRVKTPEGKNKVEIAVKKTIDFDSVNLAFLKKFEDYMCHHKFTKKVNGKLLQLNYKKNYINRRKKELKQIINEAIEQGFVKHFSLKSVKIEFEEIDTVYTDFQELQNFLTLSLEGQEEIARDKYVTNCFLGFRYSDLSKLKSHHFTNLTIDGKEYLLYRGRTVKTDRQIEFVVHPTAVSILKKYNFELPKMAGSVYNKLLKSIAYKAGLTSMVQIRETRGKDKIFKDVPKHELISSHTGRRSFCTNFYNEGVPIQAIMSISGHKTEQEFYKYINKDAKVKISFVAQQIDAIKPLEIPYSNDSRNQALALSA